MKKILTVITAIFILISCDDGLLPKPHFPQGGGTEEISFESLAATHGEKRSITLSWNHVQNAALYYIYSANNPLDTFIRCAETESNQFRFNVSPGSIVYYRVSAVFSNGQESAPSYYVKGTSLAQPVISDITDLTEDSAAVTWYMENVSDDTYKDKLLYTVYCFNGAAEVAQIALDGSGLSENKAVFTGLNANTRYEYQVEAYLRSDQFSSEKSERFDAATARRFRPGPPIRLTAARGTDTDKVKLSFVLPDMVDIALGDNTYDPKPLYFTISKRLYSENGNNEYQEIESYFGRKDFGEYSPGAVVEWTDNNVTRGVQYEYLIQSYVDETNRIISSDSSKANATGWALSIGTISFGDIDYTIDADDDFFVSARLPLVFNFDPKGIEYNYLLIETIDPIFDSEPNDPDGTIQRQLQFTNYSAIANYIVQMDLTKKTQQSNPGRGVYSYAVEIKLNDETLDTVSTIGQVEVSENTQPIIVENFRVEDGYADKFIIKWDNYANRRYILEVSDNMSSWTEVQVFNANPDNNNESVTRGFTYPFTGQLPDSTKYFRIRPSRDIGSGTWKHGQYVYTAAASRTMGVPELVPASGTASYSTITVAWKEAQMADTYRIKFWYEGEGSYSAAQTAAIVSRADLSTDAQGNLRYSFNPFGNEDINAVRAGKPIQIAIDALNVSLQTETGGGEIATTSQNPVTSRLVGPALLDAIAARASSASEITVSWNSIPGADGYYIFRRQFDITNSAESGTEAIVYYVPSSVSGSINVTGKNLVLDASNSKTDTQTVTASANLSASRYTLTDRAMTDIEYDSTAYNRHTSEYRSQQNDMVQGLPYRYFIVPVISRSGSPESLASIEFTYAKDSSNKNTHINSYRIQEGSSIAQYTAAATLDKEGFTIGFGQNVNATKGTYASTGNTNDGIKITWDAPPRLSTVEGFTPQYVLYRKVYNASSWTTLTTLSGTEYIDISAQRGIAYEYLVGISNGGIGSSSQPQHSRRFIDQCNAIRDEKNRPDMQGYMLKIVRMQSVSRDERMLGSEFAEEVTWYSEGIDNGSMDSRYGIDGYTIFVMNRNIDANWHAILDIPVENISNQMVLNTLVTNSMGGGGLLKVWRDYKHFFKVRSYVLKDDQKIYSPDPEWTYQYLYGTTEAAHITASNNMQNDYVKWGARQITAREFAQIASLYVARGVQRNRGGTWTSNLAWSRSDASTNNGGSGYVRNQSNTGVTTRNWEFRNYKDDLQPRDNRGYITFLTVDGNMWMSTRASGWPQAYGRATDNYRENRLWITGPWDTPGLYNGAIHFGGNGTRDLGRTVSDGNIHVIYPSGTSQQTVIVHGENDTPLAWDYGLGNSNNRHRIDDANWR